MRCSFCGWNAANVSQIAFCPECGLDEVYPVDNPVDNLDVYPVDNPVDNFSDPYPLTSVYSLTHLLNSKIVSE